MRAMMRLPAAAYAFFFLLYLLIIATGLALYTVIVGFSFAVSSLRFLGAVVRRAAVWRG